MSHGFGHMTPGDPKEPHTSYPTPFQRKTLWGGITGLSMVVIGAVAILVVWLLGKVLAVLQPVLVPLAVAGILAYLLEPVVMHLVRRGWKHKHAVLLTFAISILSITCMLLVVIPTSIKQGIHLYGQRDQIRQDVEQSVERFLDSWRDDKSGSFISRTVQRIFPSNKTTNDPADAPPPTPEASEGAPPAPGTEGPPGTPEAPDPGPVPSDESAGTDWSVASGKVVDWINRSYGDLVPRMWAFINRSIQGVFGMFGYVLGLFLVPIYLFYFLIESKSIQENWTHYVPLKASKFKDEVVGTISEINGYLIAFFRGQMMVSLIDGALISICLLVIGMPYAIVIGVFVALLGLIPYIGNLLCLIPAILISIAHFSDKNNQMFGIDQIWVYPLIVIGIFTVVQQINSLVTAPKIVGDSVGLHPLTVIFSVFFWSVLMGGLLGSLLAVPLTASVKVLFRRYIWERRMLPQMPGPPEADSA